MALDFPSSPTNGQVYDNFYYDATKGTWKSLSAGASPSIITNAVISATASNATTVPLTVNGAVSQSANLQEWKNSSGSTVASILPSGQINVPKIGINGITSTTYQLDMIGRSRIRSDGVSSAGTWFTDNSGTESAFFGMGSVASSSQMGIFHTGAWRFMVDSTGAVQIPYQPSFCARGTTGITGQSTLRTLVFNQSVDFNVGSCYNSSNGRFTASVAGKYMFEFHMFATASFRQYSVINKNGTTLQEYTQEQPTGGAGQGYASLDGKLVMNLAANDYVEVQSTASILTNSGVMCSFSGYLIG